MVREAVRMYDRDTVQLVLLVFEEGMSRGRLSSSRASSVP